MIDHGELLDKKDQDRRKSNHDDELYNVSVSELRQRFFNKIIDKRHEKGTVFLEGSGFEEPNDFAPFLYFYNNISIQICRACPQTTQIEKLKPYLDKGLLTIFLTNNFSTFSKEFQEFAFKYQDDIIGPHCYNTYKFYKLNDELPHKSVEEGGTCLHCDVNDRLAKAVKQYNTTEKKLGEVSGLARLIPDIPTKAVDFATNLFIDSIKKQDKDEFQQTYATLHLMDHLTKTNAFETTPQMNSQFMEKSEIFLTPLKINHEPDVELDHYLDVVKDFRGTIPSNITEMNEVKILEKVTKINEEINKIQSSQRLTVGQFLYKFSMAVPEILSKILTSGSYGPEGTLLKSIKNIKIEQAENAKNQILKKFFGVSNLGINIWEIQKKLQKL